MRDLCARTGLSRQAIHFYVAQGLVEAPKKTGRTMGYYTEAHVERILLVRRLQEEHFLPLKAIRAMILLDMIGDRSLNVKRDTSSTPWLSDLVWATARKLGHGAHFLDEPFPVEDDHMHFLKAGIPAVDVIDLDYPDWHTAGDTLDKVSARSLQVVGDVVLAALPDIEARLLK